MAMFEEMKNEILKEINGGVSDAEMTFTTEEGDVYRMYHKQDCCETVSIVDVVGDLSDLIGNPILLAEEVVGGDTPEDLGTDEDYSKSFTWTFYKLSTIMGSVTIRWLGESNGYYSESVNFSKTECKEPWITLPKYGPQETN